MPACAAVNCTNRSEQGFIMKVFPRNPVRRDVWASRVKRENWIPNKNSYLCEVHFDKDQWEEGAIKGKKKLKKNADPTIFSHRPAKFKRKLPLYHNLQIQKKSKLSNEFDDNYENSEVSNNTHSDAELEQKLACLLQLNEELKKQNISLKVKLNQKNTQIWRLKEQLRKRTNMKLTKVFNSDQIQSLEQVKFNKWSNKTCEIALGLRFACGKSGYENLLHLGYPLPSIRTLQRRLQHLQFKAGILEDVLKFLKLKVDAFNYKQEKCCALLIDEMSISEAIEFDISSNQYIGEVTVPGQAGRAKQALVFMLAGISTRWKQVVSYHFATGHTDGNVMKNLVLDVIKESEKIGLEIVCITSDMGSSNQVMWRSFGICCGRNATKANIQHPFDNSRSIDFIADVPHLMKNIRSSLISNQKIIIPDSLQLKYNLPTNIINPKHLEKLVDFQENMDLKLAPKLTPQHLKDSHFDKMKVSRATHVINNDTSAALKYISEEKQDESYLATAWFIRHVQKWFALMTSRHPVMALSKNNYEEYFKAIGFLAETITLFKNLKVINNLNKPVWKPIQTGVILSTTAIINLQAKLLGEKKFHMLLTSRFSQDSLENLFSVIRSKQAVPTPLQFRNNLKLVCISQYLKQSTGSYDADDRNFLTGALEVAIRPAVTEATKIVLPSDWDRTASAPFSLTEMNCLYHISGYIISSLLKKHEICSTCVTSVATKETVAAPFSKLVKFKEYKQGCLYYVTEDAFNKLFVSMELLFRKLEKYISKTSSNCTKFIKNIFQQNTHIQNLSFPECHNIKTKIINRFILFRLKIFAIKVNKNLKKQEKLTTRKPVYSSKSVAKLSKATK